MTIKPLGDIGLLATLPDEAAAVGLAVSIRNANPIWLVDVVPAYATVGVFFHPDRASSAEVADWVRKQSPSTRPDGSVSKIHTIPVCYELQLDLNRVAEHCEMTPDEVIVLHSVSEYTVYAIGFVPGFPYLGYLPEKSGRCATVSDLARHSRGAGQRRPHRQTNRFLPPPSPRWLEPDRPNAAYNRGCCGWVLPATGGGPGAVRAD